MKKTVLFILSFLFLASLVWGQTTLSAGDIVLVTVNADDNKNFDFVTLVNIGASTVIKFTDNGWDSSLNEGNGGWATSEGIITFTAPVTVSAGEVVSYSGSDGNGFVKSGSFNPSASGDNIIVYQGTEASPSFLYGIGWAKAASWSYNGTNDSDIPPGLSEILNTILNLGTYDNYQYNGSTSFASPSEFLIAVGNVSNWSGRNENAYSAFEGDIILPVTLSSFTASYSNSTPTIYWVTESESDNLGWNVYRANSSNLGQASILNLNIIPGNGTTTEPSYYSFVDEYEIQENFIYWYWLESIAISSETEMFGPIALTIPLDNNYIPEIPIVTELHTNFPNPFNPNTSISFDIKEGENGVLTIYNIKGQLIEKQMMNAGEHTFEWDGTAYGSGVYFYKLETDSYTETKKMLMLK